MLSRAAKLSRIRGDHSTKEVNHAGFIIEAAIMWAINEAKLNSETDEIIQDGSSELCDFVRDVLEKLDLAEEGSYLIEDL